MTHKLAEASRLADAALVPERCASDGEDLAELLRASLERLAQALTDADPDAKMAIAMENARVRSDEILDEVASPDYTLLVGRLANYALLGGGACLWLLYKSRAPSMDVVRECVKRWNVAMIVHVAAGGQGPSTLSDPGKHNLLVHELSITELTKLPAALLFDAFGYRYLNDIRALPGANRRIEDLLREYDYDRKELLDLALRYDKAVRLDKQWS